MRRSVLLKVSVAALLATGMGALSTEVAWAQSSPLPDDESRGVFTFAQGLEKTLPAVVQVTTLGFAEYRAILVFDLLVHGQAQGVQRTVRA